MKKYSCLLLLPLFSFVPVFAQEDEEGCPSIQLDRPDQTECAFIVPKGYLQFEAGFNIEHIADHHVGYSYPSLLTKFGVNDRFELRLISEWYTDAVYSETTTGLIPLTIGFKTNIIKGHGFVPRISFIGHIATAKLGSQQFRNYYPAPEFRFTIQHELSDRWSLGYNIGAEWDGYFAEPTYIYTLTTGYSFTDQIGGYAEIFGFVDDQLFGEHLVDAGLTFLVSDNVMLDVSAGKRVFSDELNYYYSLGFSARINCKRQRIEDM